QRNEPRPFSKLRVLTDSLNNFTGLTQESYNKLRGVQGVLDLLKTLEQFKEGLDEEGLPDLLTAINDALSAIMQVPEIKDAVSVRPRILNITQLSKCDFLIRKPLLKNFKNLLELVYQLDAFIAVSKAAMKHDLSYPILLDTRKPTIKI